MKLWLIVVKDKEADGEPDIGMAVIEGNELAAKRRAEELEAECHEANRRCVARWREIERGRSYRATALVKTGLRRNDK